MPYCEVALNLLQILSCWTGSSLLLHSVWSWYQQHTLTATLLDEVCI